MISTKQNHLYAQELAGWRKKEFQTADRRGPYIEQIYMNYPEPTFLHQYNFVGNGFTDRQRMKRKRERFAGKITGLPEYEKHLFIQEFIKKEFAAVKHFLSITS